MKTNEAKLVVTVGDLVTYFGKLIGRVSKIENGWALVGVDEFQVALLAVAK